MQEKQKSANPGRASFLLFSFRHRLRPPPADVSGRRFRTVSPAEARRTSSGATTGSPRSSWRRASEPRRATGWLRPRGGRGGSLGSAGRGGMERAWEWTHACSDFWVALAFGKPHSRLSLFHSYGWCPRRGIPKTGSLAGPFPEHQQEDAPLGFEGWPSKSGWVASLGLKGALGETPNLLTWPQIGRDDVALMSHLGI